MATEFRLSVAVPIHNEESVLPELLMRLRAVLDGLPGGPHEIVFVDDGSSDRTFAILEEAARRDSRIVVLSLSRNFGHQSAITAALDHITGDAAVVMDGDLQDVPEAIPQFVERHHQGFDVVYAQRIRRKEPWPLRLSYFVFYRMMASLSDVRLPLDSGDFGLMSRRVIDQLRRMPEHHRYLRGMRSWVGFRQAGIPVEREERHSGKKQVQPLAPAQARNGRNFRFFNCSNPCRRIAGRCRYRRFHAVRLLCPLLSNFLAAITSGFHGVDCGGYVSFGHGSLFPGSHW